MVTWGYRDGFSKLAVGSPDLQHEGNHTRGNGGCSRGAREGCGTSMMDAGICSDLEEDSADVMVTVQPVSFPDHGL